MAQSMNAAALAYLGDAVFELMTREKLLTGGLPVNKAHKEAKNIVSARAQSEIYHRIYPTLSNEEQTIMRRGRNLHPIARAKNAETTEYRHATGVEALFGYLYHKGDTARMEEIFELCTSE